MPMTLGILVETATAETRVATTPDMVKKYVSAGAVVMVQSGAGMSCFYTDADYVAAGATIAPSRDMILGAADIIMVVQAPPVTDIARMKPGAVLVGLVASQATPDMTAACKSQNVTLMAMEFVPRTTRAQNVDALSSQSNLAGYRAVIEAISFYGRAMPMMMTAAGTIAPAKVFVMGAGVAGLQAIATARRLGAVVSATDVRMAAKEQVESLGAAFVMVEDDETRGAETAGGYARDMSDAYKQKQAALIAATIKKQDIVITTALIPGRPAPKLVTDDMVLSMRPGSVIVDMGAVAGGNVAGTVPGEIVVKNGVTIIGYTNLPAHIATDASALYARNLYNLFALLVAKDTGTITINLNDDIIKAMTITHAGATVREGF